MSKVVNINDYRPHLSVWEAAGASNVLHVIPRSFFDDVIAGKREITELEGWEKLMPSILTEWLTYLKQFHE